MAVSEKQETVSSTAGDDPVKIEEEEEDTTVYPKGIQFVMLMASFYLGVFMVSLVRRIHFQGCSRNAFKKETTFWLAQQDKLIVSTAIPQITNDFKSPDDIGWYGTAYLLTNAAFQLLFGKLYKFVPIKATFLGSILVFVVGSTVCAAAPNSIAFIIGRAIAGVGAGGVLSGVVSSALDCSALSLMLTSCLADGCVGVLRTAW
jgi:MFS family permease